MSALLEVSSVSVTVAGKCLLDDVSFSLDRGRVAAFIGPNGAGKSTLIGVLSGALKASSGTVKISAFDLGSLAPGVLAHHRAVLSQHVSVAFAMTVSDIVQMGLGARSSTADKALVEETLAELDLHHLAGRAVNTLSGGERQRTHFARVLVQAASGRRHGGSGILLLDEPTTGLDLNHQLKMLSSFRRHAVDGMLVVAVLHDLNLAALVADQVFVFDRGRLDSAGHPAEVINDAMIERVFGVRLRVGQAPSDGIPFVLLQASEDFSRFS
jgi:iron complex transport system ATP-binding protein